VTLQQFYKLLELGFFRGKRVELVNGVIYEMPAQKNDHLIIIHEVAQAVERAFGRGYWARIQGSLDLRPLSVLDPDVALVAGKRRAQLGQPNPTTALLIVEVSDTTVGYDRHRKASIYARAGIADYWIVNLKRRHLEVRRQPGPNLSAKHNYGYGSLTILRPPEVVSPLAAPKAKIPVADLLP
jgi:Uma2 family endonuclease